MGKLTQICRYLDKEYCNLDCDNCGWNPEVAQTRLRKKYDEDMIRILENIVICQKEETHERKKR